MFFSSHSKNDPAKKGRVSPEARRQKLREQLLKKLVHRDHTALELDQYLKRKEATELERESLIGELKKEGLVNDEEVFRQLCESAFRRQRGPLYILQKCQAKGLEMNLDEILEKMPEDPQAIIDRCLQKRFGQDWQERSKDSSVQAKMARFLKSRGFLGESIRKALFF
jgi:SOS response regulatory protein OraA/RecX